MPRRFRARQSRADDQGSDLTATAKRRGAAAGAGTAGVDTVQIRLPDESLRGGSYHPFLDFLIVPAVAFAMSGSSVWYLTCFRAKLDLMLPTPGTLERNSRMKRSNAGTSCTRTRNK